MYSRLIQVMLFWKVAGNKMVVSLVLVCCNPFGEGSMVGRVHGAGGMFSSDDFSRKDLNAFRLCPFNTSPFLSYI